MDEGSRVGGAQEEAGLYGGGGAPAEPQGAPAAPALEEDSFVGGGAGGAGGADGPPALPAMAPRAAPEFNFEAAEKAKIMAKMQEFKSIFKKYQDGLAAKIPGAKDSAKLESLIALSGALGSSLEIMAEGLREGTISDLGIYVQWCRVRDVALRIRSGSLTSEQTRFFAKLFQLTPYKIELGAQTARNSLSRRGLVLSREEIRHFVREFHDFQVDKNAGGGRELGHPRAVGNSRIKRRRAGGSKKTFFWSAEEDRRLLSAEKETPQLPGIGRDWAVIAKKVGGDRTGKACKHRFFRLLGVDYDRGSRIQERVRRRRRQNVKPGGARVEAMPSFGGAGGTPAGDDPTRASMAAAGGAGGVTLAELANRLDEEEGIAWGGDDLAVLGGAAEDAREELYSSDSESEFAGEVGPDAAGSRDAKRSRVEGMGRLERHLLELQLEEGSLTVVSRIAVQTFNAGYELLPVDHGGDCMPDAIIAAARAAGIDSTRLPDSTSDVRRDIGARMQQMKDAGLLSLSRAIADAKAGHPWYADIADNIQTMPKRLWDMKIDQMIHDAVTTGAMNNQIFARVAAGYYGIPSVDVVVDGQEQMLRLDTPAAWRVPVAQLPLTPHGIVLAQAGAHWDGAGPLPEGTDLTAATVGDHFADMHRERVRELLGLDDSEPEGRPSSSESSSSSEAGSVMGDDAGARGMVRAPKLVGCDFRTVALQEKWLQEKFEVRPSGITRAGRGAFATEDIPAGFLIPYVGGLWPSNRALRESGITNHQYAMDGLRVWPAQNVIDGNPEIYGSDMSPHNPAPYVNDPRGSEFSPNVQITYFKDEGDSPYRNWAESVSPVGYRTTRAIKKGEELFADYGPKYEFPDDD